MTNVIQQPVSNNGTRWSLFVVQCSLLGVLSSAHAQTLPHKGGAADPNIVDVVVLDAGHGGKDPGNLGTGRYKTTEKDIEIRRGETTWVRTTLVKK